MLIKLIKRAIKAIRKWFNLLLKKTDGGKKSEGRDTFVPIDSDAFKPINTSGKDAPFLKVGEIRFGQHFENPHRNIDHLQRKTADAIFSLVGGSYLPRRLLWFLKRYDAFQATQRFLDIINLDYDTLLRERKARKFFGKFLDVLVEVDEILRESELSDLPFYNAAATSNYQLDKIEQYVDRLHKVADIAKVLKSHKIIFPDYTSFYDEAKEQIKNWGLMDDKLISTIYSIFRDWQKLQNGYDKVNHKINKLIERIANHLSEKKCLLAKIIKKIERYQKDTESGKIEPAEGIEKLYEIYEDLEKIAEEFSLGEEGKEKSKDREREHTRRDDRIGEDNEIKKALKTLGLIYQCDLNLDTIKKAYRKLAKRYHPDNPDGNANEQQMKEINLAYKILREHFQKKEKCT